MSDVFEIIDERLKSYHNEHYNSIETLIKRLNNISVSTLSSLSIDSLSIRHLINDRIREITMLIERYQKTLDAYYISEHESIKDKYRDFRDMKTHINIKYPKVHDVLTKLKVEKDYCKDCIDTLTALDYKIKDIINLEKGFL